MRIRLAILENDAVYLNRLVSVFNVKYAEKLEIYSFTDRGEALQSLQRDRINVFLAEESFTIEETEIPSQCGFACLVDAMDVESVGGIPAVCKFQKAELIYRQVYLSV